MVDMINRYKDVYYRVSDGLRLYARDYPSTVDNKADLTVLCMHGLTRNSADFEDIALELSGHCRVIVAEQRGRGLSQWDDQVERYNPLTYVQDMWQLLDHLQVERVVLLGTSMGGLMSMMMAAQVPERIQAIIINDIGPEIHQPGLERIKSYVGKGQSVESWVDAVAETQRINGSCFPDYNDAQWLQMTYRLYRENTDGVPVLAYDPAIAKPIDASDEAAVPPDLWPLFNGLSAIPVMALRGELSDLLSETCFEAMQQQLPNLRAVTVPRVGHAPALDEVVAVRAIKEFISSIQHHCLTPVSEI